MTFATGRIRTLTWSGSLAGTAHWKAGPAPEIPDSYAAGFLSAQVAGCSVSSHNATEVTASNGIVADTRIIPFVGDFTHSMGGTWTIALDVEEFATVGNLDLALVDEHGYPTFGGQALKDGPIARRIHFHEQLRVGGTATATITSGSLTATATSIIGPAQSRAASYNLELRTAGDILQTPADYAISGGVNDGGWGGGTYTHTVLGPGNESARGTVEAVGDALVATLSLVSAPAPSRPVFGDVRASVLRGSGYEVAGRATRWTDTYDGQLSAHVKTTADTGVDIQSNEFGQWAPLAVVHRIWSASATLQGLVQPSISGGVPPTNCRVHLRTESLAARGEDSRDWRLAVAGKPFRCITASHEALSPLAVLPRPAEGYRYLRVWHRSVGAANQTWALIIGAKRWNLRTGADGVIVITDLDLCRPDSETALTDGKESRYPLDAPGGRPIDSPYWGASWISAITFEGPPEVQVTSYELARLSPAARLSWCPALTPWLHAWTSPTDRTYHKPHGWSEVDGRVADLPAAFFVDMTARGDYYAHQTIEQSRSRLVEFGGWSAELFGSWPDAYHNETRDAWWIGGGGFVWRGFPSGQWHSEIDRTVSGPTDVWAQALWDEVQGYPGIGDVWENAPYPVDTDPPALKRLPVRFSKVIRAQAWGLVHGPGTLVTLRRSADMADRGSGVPGAVRFYRTLHPYAQGEVGHHVEVAPDRSGGFLAHNRMRHRQVLRTRELLLGGPHLTTDNDRMAAIIPSETGAVLWVWDHRSLNRTAVLALASAPTECQVAPLPHGRWAVVVTVGGVALRYETSNDGTNWSQPMTIGSATHAAIAVDMATGIEYVAGWSVDRWRIWRRLPHATEFGSPLADIVVAPEGRGGLEIAPVGGGRLIFIYPTGTGIERRVSADRGQTWSTV